MDEQLAAISRALSWLEGHLAEADTVEAFAAASGYSLFHFARTFNRLVHHTPYDYIIRRRLSEAARQLTATRRRVIDIGLEAGFNNPETFARAFKRMFGIQPSQTRQAGRLDPRCLLTPRTPAHLEHIQCCDFLHPTLVERPALRLAGLMTRLQGGPAAVPELWSALAQESGPGGECYGVTTYPADWAKNGVFYFAGISLREGQSPPPALVTRDLPAGLYAQFSHHGGPSCLPLTRDYIYQTWLPLSGKKLSGVLEVETYAGPLADGDCQLCMLVS